MARQGFRSLPSKKPAFIILSVVIGLLFVVTGLLVARWPFTEAGVTKELEAASAGSVVIEGFRGTYFPRPGCIARGVKFYHDPGAPPLITIETLRIESGILGLFGHHVGRIRAQGMRVAVPSSTTADFHSAQSSRVTVDELIADNSILEIERHSRKPLKFVFHEFRLRNAGGDREMAFQARFTNPVPPGEISTTGHFGPWQNDFGQIRVSGNYAFQNADLGVFGGISGKLFSEGKFDGNLGHIGVQGRTEVPDFAVHSSSHEVDLRTSFQAHVDARNGDVFLEHVSANFRNTKLEGEGSIVQQASAPGKLASLDFQCSEGRIQDVLLLFIKSERAPMKGMIAFRAKVTIPPEKLPFLKKVRLLGEFGIDAGKFTKAETQAGIERLSKGSLDEKEKDDPATTLSNLKGSVVLGDGTATLSNLSFNVPGAAAQMSGTYNVINQKIDLHGTLRTESELSKSTSGTKAFLLKILNPLFKKKTKGSIAPVKITGTYGHPSYALDLGSKHPHPGSGQ
jgi:hypothetical protein